MDKYQERYLAHQSRKKGQLLELMEKRYSERIFSDKRISGEDMSRIITAYDLAPSSCNRQGVSVFETEIRDDKQLLGGLLVGGVGWVHRADRLILLIGDIAAYKEGLQYMPYLDAGFIAQNIWLECTDLGIQCCFVNPNVREEHKKILQDHFLGVDQILCGVLAIGYKDD